MDHSLKAVVLISVQLLLLTLLGCSSNDPTAAPADHEEAEPIARTEFTDRIENFFEFEPLHAGKPTQFLIHLTDLEDGAPVEQAQVVVTVRPRGGTEVVAQTTARVGRVTGIYVADVNVPQPGDYDIEFHIKNAKLDERLPLRDFKVE